VSRAVRTPGPADEDVKANLAAFPLGGGAVGESRLIGADMQSEVMTSVELGYRVQLDPRLSIDLASFQNRYVHLRAIEAGTPFAESDPAPAHTVFPEYFTNGYHGTTRGLEGTLEWRPDGRFGMTVSHSLFWMELKPDPGFLGLASDAAGDAPRYELSVHPHALIARHFTVDATWYHVDDLPTQGASAYDRVDARLGWSRSRRLELAAGVQNLFHDRDLEFGSVSGTILPTTVRTGVYGQVTWRP
jgi:outer membrane receptor protein involved in Fe transport